MTEPDIISYCTAALILIITGISITLSNSIWIPIAVCAISILGFRQLFKFIYKRRLNK